MAVRYPIPALPQTFNGRESMRSIADACERLREEDQSPSGSLTQVRTFPFTLPSSALLREPSVSVERARNSATRWLCWQSPANPSPSARFP